jgi:lipoyl(octanoyl) transferase
VQNEIIKIEIINDLLDYKNGILLMEDFIAKKEEKILILEHNDIFTYGKGHDYKGKEFLNNIEVLKSTRGGDLTYHGPGQIICYFIFDYRKRNIKVINFINALEEFMINFLLKQFNIICKKSILGHGLWINDKKFMFIGLNASRGFISHGISINYDINLNYFNMIKPCNLETKIGNLREQIKVDVSIFKIKNLLKIEIEKLWYYNFFFI